MFIRLVSEESLNYVTLLYIILVQSSPLVFEESLNYVTLLYIILAQSFPLSQLACFLTTKHSLLEGKLTQNDGN